MLHSNLPDSEARFRSLLEIETVGVVFFDDLGGITDANNAFLRMIGYTREELQQGTIRYDVLTPPEWRWRDEETLAELKATGQSRPCEKEYVRKDGSRLWILCAGKALGEGSAIEFVLDITGRKHTEAALKESESRLTAELSDARRLQQISNELIQEQRLEALYEQLVEAAAMLMRSDAASMQEYVPARGQLRLLASRGFHPKSAAHWQWVDAHSGSTCAASLASGEREVVGDVETCGFMIGTKDLDECRRSNLRAVQSTPLLSRTGQLIGMISTHWRQPHEPSQRQLRLFDILARQAADLIDRVRAQEALRESEERFRLIVENARDYAILTTDPQDRITDWLPGAAAVFGWAAEEAIGHPASILYTPEDREEGVPEKESERARKDGFAPNVRWHQRRDGSRVFIEGSVTALHSANGDLRGFLKIGQDVTARRAAEERLRESEAALRKLNETLEAEVSTRTAELRRALDTLHAEVLERAQAEEALRQSQKMQAVGQLTGGIAHDFNNMLQGIAGNLELMGRYLEQGRTEQIGRLLDRALKVVGRAASLTHRLLAFARRQTLQPKSVHADALIEDMADLIRRSVGPGVRVELRLNDDSWPVRCDPNQLETALLNVAINSRDAMPNGGKLTICTRHLYLGLAELAGEEGASAGDYIEITASDTGSGMDTATKARVFEPFFTTKPLGQGTGLGLSQLYGFVRQSSGVVRLDSTPGQGTAVRIYLPCQQHGADTEETGEGRGVLPAGLGDGGTVLLLEDEADVRATAAEHLRALGYKVLEAADGPAALRLLRGSKSVHVDLLVTDVGLPNGLNGRQVADAAREAKRVLPVLFITGYAAGALESQLEPGMAIMAKPFTLETLAAKVQSMISPQRQPDHTVG
ncbi:MAG: PAS domain S-box protein [Acetobacteraceae bacterium]|nr:PAS domain S-box protein [Acetobacteraceae bacterium]